MKKETDLIRPNDNGNGNSAIENAVYSDYKYGFVTNIEADEAPMGLSEDIVRFISAKKMNRSGCWSGA